MQPWGGPVPRVSVEEVMFLSFTTWGLPIRKFRIQLNKTKFSLKFLSLTVVLNAKEQEFMERSMGRVEQTTVSDD